MTGGREISGRWGEDGVLGDPGLCCSFVIGEKQINKNNNKKKPTFFAIFRDFFCVSTQGFYGQIENVHRMRWMETPLLTHTKHKMPIVDSKVS